jgi:hypothetical protein
MFPADVLRGRVARTDETDESKARGTGSASRLHFEFPLAQQCSPRVRPQFIQSLIFNHRKKKLSHYNSHSECKNTQLGTRKIPPPVFFVLSLSIQKKRSISPACDSHCLLKFFKSPLHHVAALLILQSRRDTPDSSESPGSLN